MVDQVLHEQYVPDGSVADNLRKELLARDHVRAVEIVVMGTKILAPAAPIQQHFTGNPNKTKRLRNPSDSPCQPKQTFAQT